MIDRWAHLGHQLGECWFNKDLAYINIPKNATSTVKGYLIAEHWQNSSTLIECDRYFTVLRDPLQRWVSGMAQYQINSGRLDLSEEEIFDTITFDDHTETQSYFLTPFDLDRTVYFKCDSSLRELLEKFLNISHYSFDDRNISQGPHAECKHRILEMLKTNPKNLNKVMAHFAVDYKLMSSIKYYD
jgi:hypothetical protein